jgi:HK97 family phage portal protein
VAFVSNGVVLKSSLFTPLSFNGVPQPGITPRWEILRESQWGAYGEIYARHLWVSVLVNKIANATARLPLKVYERNDLDRPEARGHPYAELLRNPNDEMDPFLFWMWMSSTLNIYGEAFAFKVRDGAGRPVKLMPWHPTLVHDEFVDGVRYWSITRGDGERQPVRRRDFVHFRMYNPRSQHRGMSPLEPLRDTLINEYGARTASTAMWQHGGRPSVILKHPGSFRHDSTVTRLRDQWNDIHGGVENWAKPAILEEGMDAQVIQLSSEELQYIESRKLNREECCAAYDVPPPVVHILDRATFSNITEQMRSMYRDTMAPKLKLIESTLEVELRDGRMGRTDIPPDFGDSVYAEFLMDEVLRGDFEQRMSAKAQAIQTGQLTPAEARKMENLPFIEGSDQLFINGAVVPLATAAEPPADVPIPTEQMRSLMGRLSRAESVADIDPGALVAGLNGHSQRVLIELERAQMADLSVAQFRERLRNMEASGV